VSTVPQQLAQPLGWALLQARLGHKVHALLDCAWNALCAVRASLCIHSLGPCLFFTARS
jgi:hypothetical protein